ncbi:MAG: cation acetate symporter [Candidatus Eremiobacteraeota bacterium]|nr:cation acetate symporter [Candidatus Eremiobacteraeota bacterium]MBV8366700.1 cation acetate symporter [Candidatus Eremiobacteraeota bacterium]
MGKALARFGFPRALQGEGEDDRATHDLLHRLLLRAAGQRRLFPNRHGDEGHRRHQHRVPLRALRVRDDLDRHGHLRQSRETLGCRSRSHRRQGERGSRMSTQLILFIVIIAITLGITAWASSRNRTKEQFMAANRQITGFQNGWAVAGDYMSAASFLGIAGLIAFNGYDGFMYSVGWLVAYLTVLLLVAEPLRNIGKYTMADVLAFRLQHNSVRAVAAISTLTISIFYMLAQMIGAGSLINLLIPQISFTVAIVGVGILMLVYVIFGGMLATTWVQIVKAVLLMFSAIVISVLVMAHFHWSFLDFFSAIASVTGTIKNKAGEVVQTLNFTQPGLLYHGKYGALGLISLGVALIFGTAGLPHILIRFYTVPSAQAARTSVVWATVLIGAFYLMTTFLGFGAATIVGKANIGVHTTGAKATEYIASIQAEKPEEAAKLQTQLSEKGYIVKAPNTNLAAPLLAGALGGDFFLAFVSAVAFATILAVVAGLTIGASTSFAHDVWFNVVKGGVEDEGEQLVVARITAAVVGVIAILLAIGLRSLNVAFLVGLAFAVAASANVPAILLSLYWKRMNTTGTIVGMITGLVSSLVLIAVSPAVMGIDPEGAATRHLIQGEPLFPLDNPALVTVPLGFIAAVVAALLTHEKESEETFPEMAVRANTGLGAEV